MKNLLLWIILVAGAAYGGAKLYLHKEVSDAMDKAVLMMSPYADVRYAGVASTLSGELTVEGVLLRIDGFRDDIFIERIGIDTPSFLSLLELSDLASRQGDEMPEYFGFLVEGMHVPANADYYESFYNMTLQSRGVDAEAGTAVECTGRYGFSPRALAALGYDEQVVSMSMRIRDEETRYSFDMRVAMEDMWDLDASVAMAGNFMAEVASGAGFRPKLQTMRLQFTDRSLNRRVSEYCQREGLSAAETLRARMESFEYVGKSNGIEFDQYMLEPYKEFVLGKPTLVVTAQPSEPVAFSQIGLYKPSDVPALLNLAAVAR